MTERLSNTTPISEPPRPRWTRLDLPPGVEDLLTEFQLYRIHFDKPNLPLPRFHEESIIAMKFRKFKVTPRKSETVIGQMQIVPIFPNI